MIYQLITLSDCNLRIITKIQGNLLGDHLYRDWITCSNYLPNNTYFVVTFYISIYFCLNYPAILIQTTIAAMSRTKRSEVGITLTSRMIWLSARNVRSITALSSQKRLLVDLLQSPRPKKQKTLSTFVDKESQPSSNCTQSWLWLTGTIVKNAKSLR